MAGINDAAKTGRGASAVTANLRRSGGPEPAVSCHGGSERQPQPQGQKAKTKLLSFLSVEKISARHGTEGWRIGIGFLSQSQSPSQFRPAGEGLFFVSISDYYLPIIRTFSGEAHCPGQPLESPNPREPGSITRLHSPPQTLLPLVFQVFSYSSLICVLFPYYPPMVWICSAHEMHMRLSGCYIKRLLFVYFSEIKSVINRCWMAIEI